MVLCICNNVTDLEVDRAIAEGAHTPEAVAGTCRGAGNDCGCCLDAIEERIVCSRTGCGCTGGACEARCADAAVRSPA